MNETIERLKRNGFVKSCRYIWYEIAAFVKRTLFSTYSQLGEDVVIDSILGNKSEGFYIDVGANDPIRFNNTARFYKKGWCGINIEPDIKKYKKLLKMRPRDINLNVGVSTKTGFMTFYKFIPDTLSTFSIEERDNNIKMGYKMIDEIHVETVTLSSIVSTYANNRAIDFLTIDTEGNDLDVLKSYDWEHGPQPKLICLEIFQQQNGEIDDYLTSLGYVKKYDNGLNAIYVYSSSS